MIINRLLYCLAFTLTCSCFKINFFGNKTYIARLKILFNKYKSCDYFISSVHV